MVMALSRIQFAFLRSHASRSSRWLILSKLCSALIHHRSLLALLSTSCGDNPTCANRNPFDATLFRTGKAVKLFYHCCINMLRLSLPLKTSPERPRPINTPETPAQRSPIINPSAESSWVASFTGSPSRCRFVDTRMTPGFTATRLTSSVKLSTTVQRCFASDLTN